MRIHRPCLRGSLLNHMQSFLNCPSTQKNYFDELHDSRDDFPQVSYYILKRNLQVIWLKEQMLIKLRSHDIKKKLCVKIRTKFRKSSWVYNDSWRGIDDFYCVFPLEYSCQVLTECLWDSLREREKKKMQWYHLSRQAQKINLGTKMSENALKTRVIWNSRFRSSFFFFF